MPPASVRWCFLLSCLAGWPLVNAFRTNASDDVYQRAQVSDGRRWTTQISNGLRGTAAKYVKSMELTALPARDKYESVEGMQPTAVQEFLAMFQKEVLDPELAEDGYARMVSAKESVVIFGDLHGQLFNLIAHLKNARNRHSDLAPLPESKLLLCDSKLQYVFMGDYVDRGERGMEIVLLLFAYKVLCPEGLILMQGNHEAARTNDHYGFKKEVMWKTNTKQVWEAMNEAFEMLPFAAVSKGNFLATHGGLSKSLYSKCWIWIRGDQGDLRKCLTYAIGKEMVWADPHEGKGWVQSKRGAGIMKHGVDVTQNFLKNHDLKRLIRGHEQKAQGQETIVLEKPGFAVHTVFSSADYVGVLCVDEQQRPKRPPVFERMLQGPGAGNEGAIMFVDFAPQGETTYDVTMITGEFARNAALAFSGASCEDPTAVSSLELSVESSGLSVVDGAEDVAQSPNNEDNEAAPLPADSFLQSGLKPQPMGRAAVSRGQKWWRPALASSLHRSLLQTAEPPSPAPPGSPASPHPGVHVVHPGLAPVCQSTLSQKEVEDYEAFVREKLSGSLDMVFEARAIIDLEGEAEVEDVEAGAEQLEECRSQAKDFITVRIYEQMSQRSLGIKSHSDLLQQDIAIRDEVIQEDIHEKQFPA